MRLQSWWLLPLLVGLQASAGELPPEELRFFEYHVRPLLAERCYSCHGPERQSANLRLDSPAALAIGGLSGPVIEPGRPDDSLLVEAIRYETFGMPPTGKLAEEEIQILTRWVDMGAPWPGDDGSVRPIPESGSKITAEDRSWWAFQPIDDPVPPRVDDGGWCRNDVDRFVYRRLSDEGLLPAAPADRHALIRRAHFDLLGLPPTPEEVARFVADESEDAYRRLIDRLLESPRYGERWARHWLDLVRYAESDGYRQDAYRPHAWRYRDYVVRAFNEDKPYDRFVLEQLAGDELAPHDPEALDATGYLRHWVYEHNQRDVRGQWDAILIDVTDVTADVFLGLGMGCARCHDHKFDPILQEDYFSLQAFFAPLLPRDDLPRADGEQWAEYQRQMARWEEQTADIRREMSRIEQPLVDAARRGAVEKFPLDIRSMMLKSPDQREPLEHQLAELAERQARAEMNQLDFAKRLKGEELEKWLEYKEQLDGFESLKPAPLPPAFTVTDVGPRAPPTQIPGDRRQREIPPGFPTVLGASPYEIAPSPSGDSTGRRTALARWIASRDNPLTARVVVNRVWQQHFGVGLVPTASDFGRLGAQPTHPELLDWLASRFIQGGWRFKELHRLIMNSATYRQSALRSPSEIALALEKDPQNRWLWRGSIRRLDAEQIRDAMLSASGELVHADGGPSVDHSQPRRGIYCRVIRNTRDPLLDAFDAADGFVSTDRRNVTTTATQALLMINAPWPLARARAFAARLERQRLESDAARIEHAYRLALGRSPEPEELQAALEFLQARIAAIDSAAAATAAEPPPARQIPGRQGQAVQIAGDRPEDRLVLPENASLPSQDFTIEAVILLRSLYDDASVRTIVSQWDDHHSHPGWSLGVTSRQSRYQPRNLILQLVDDPAAGGAGYEVIASDLRPELDRPYYVAASLRIADDRSARVTFSLQDLSDPDAALQTSEVSTPFTGHYRSPSPLVIGGRDGSAKHVWDGLIGEVRLSDTARHEADLLVHDPAVDQQTVGWWRFEAADFYADASGRDNRLTPGTRIGRAGAASQALVDLCHVLLNSNEFLYVD